MHVNRQLVQLSKERKSSEVFLANLSQKVEKLRKLGEEVETLKRDNEELKVLLKEAQLEVLSVDDEAFDIAKVQAIKSILTLMQWISLNLFVTVSWWIRSPASLKLKECPRRSLVG